jgi:hypothetical protein
MPKKKESVGAVEPLVIAFDDFHYHEIMDRCNIICDIIETAIIEHPATDLQMKAWAEDAQRQIYNVANMAATKQSAVPKTEPCDGCNKAPVDCKGSDDCDILKR